jgi:hypothetical protein
MSNPALARTLRSLADPTTDLRDASVAFTANLPVTGAAIATLGELLGSETISASSPLAAHMDELHFDLGEGPCWDALQHFTPVLATDLPTAQRRWPAFAPAAMERGVTAVFAFPLFIGHLRIGAVDLYTTTASSVLDGTQQDRAAAMATVVSRRVLQRALANSVDIDDGLDSNPHSRRIVHQATGMVLAQLDLTPEDARLVIQGHAFATGQTMMVVAQQLIDRTLSFTNTDSGIEER